MKVHFISTVVVNQQRCETEPFNYSSNQRVIWFNRSMRLSGLPLRLNSWLASGKRTHSTSFRNCFNATNICSLCSIGQRKSFSPCTINNGVSMFSAYFKGENSHNFAGSSRRFLPSSHLVKKYPISLTP